MKFNKEKCEVLFLGRNNLRHLNMLGAKQMESFAEKALGVLMGTELNVSWKYTFPTKKGKGLLGCIGQCCQQVKGGDPSPLFNSGETHLSAVSSVGLPSKREAEATWSMSSKRSPR